MFDTFITSVLTYRLIYVSLLSQHLDSDVRTITKYQNIEKRNNIWERVVPVDED